MTILVVVEAVLLVLVSFKLLYDYRHYNRTGELPWLARSVCMGYDLPVKSESRNSNGQMLEHSGRFSNFNCFNGSERVPSEDSNHSKLDLFRPKRYLLSPRFQNDFDSIDGMESSNEMIAQFHNRTKKISIEEAEKLDKNVLDPDLIEELQPTLIVHQPDSNELDTKTPTRKISRLQ